MGDRSSPVLILGFNYTAADLKSRSFGVEVLSRRIVTRSCGCSSRMRIGRFRPQGPRPRREPGERTATTLEFLRRARTSLDIYDPRDPTTSMLAVLGEKPRAGSHPHTRQARTENGKAPDSNARPFPQAPARFARSCAMAARVRRQSEPAETELMNAVKSGLSFETVQSSGCSKDVQARLGADGRRTQGEPRKKVANSSAP